MLIGASLSRCFKTARINDPYTYNMSGLGATKSVLLNARVSSWKTSQVAFCCKNVIYSKIKLFELFTPTDFVNELENYFEQYTF